jgi:hypothetical protein
MAHHARLRDREISQGGPRSSPGLEAKWAQSLVTMGGLPLALFPITMQIKAKLLKWIAGSVLVATTAGVLSGCVVESRPRHHYYRARPTVIIR